MIHLFIKYVTLFVCFSISLSESIIRENNLESIYMSFKSSFYVDDEPGESILNNEESSSVMDHSSNQIKIGYISKYNFGFDLNYINSNNIKNIYGLNRDMDFYDFNFYYLLKEREKIPISILFEMGKRFNADFDISNYFGLGIYKEFNNFNYPTIIYLKQLTENNIIEIDKNNQSIELGLTFKLIVNDGSNNPDFMKDNLWLDISMTSYNSDKYLSIETGISHPIQN